jgi:putative transcriptional regulator
MKVNKGSILIAEPFMGDPNFERSVILICDYSKDGAFGLVLNQETQLNLNDLLDVTNNQEFSINIGGPVEQKSLHFLHKRPDLITGGLEILKGLMLGGSFEDLLINLNLGKIDVSEIRFFLGYSGWGEGQLDQEINRDSWVVSKTDISTIMSQNSSQLWRDILKKMGGNYKVMANYPLDPKLN